MISIILQDACLKEIAELKTCVEWVIYERGCLGGELGWNTIHSRKGKHIFSISRLLFRCVLLKF